MMKMMFGLSANVGFIAKVKKIKAGIIKADTPILARCFIVVIRLVFVEQSSFFTQIRCSATGARQRLERFDPARRCVLNQLRFLVIQ